MVLASAMGEDLEGEEDLRRSLDASVDASRDTRVRAVAPDSRKLERLELEA
jgi:hypothetical protein